MAAIEAIGPNGERAVMTRKSLERLAGDGWRAATDVGPAPDLSAELQDKADELRRVAQVLEDVGTDAEKALAAFEAESLMAEPDPDLLDALEQIISNPPSTESEEG